MLRTMRRSRIHRATIPGVPGKGGTCPDGAAARLVHPGDGVIVISCAGYDEAEIAGYRPRFIFVDEENGTSRDALRAVPS